MTQNFENVYNLTLIIQGSTLNQVSIKDVARIAGVSIATVSRCINEPKRVRPETRKRVQNAINETGYSPNTLAQSFRRGKTQVIMVVLPSVGDPFFTGVMAGIREVKPWCTLWERCK